MTSAKNNQITSKDGFLSALVLVGVLGTLLSTKPTCAQSAPNVITVDAIYAKTGTLQRPVTLPGNVIAYQQATLDAKVSGYLKQITVDKGDRVKTGQLIADIEVPELVADRAQFQAQVDVANTNYQRMQQAIRSAPDLVTPETVEDAKGKLEIARAQLTRAETMLGYAKIVAPFSGVITARYADPGAFIPAATSSNQQSSAVVTLMDFHKVRVQVPVPEREAQTVRQGEAATITSTQLPGLSFKGAVTRVSYAFDPGNKTMLAEIELDNANEVLRPGMYISALLAGQSSTPALLLPSGAIVSDSGSSYVFVAQSGVAKKIRVVVGMKSDDQTEIFSGIVNGQLILLLGKAILTDGAHVNPVVQK